MKIMLAIALLMLMVGTATAPRAFADGTPPPNCHPGADGKPLCSGGGPFRIR